MGEIINLWKQAFRKGYEDGLERQRRKKEKKKKEQIKND